MSDNGICPIWEAGADGYAAHLQTMTLDTDYQMRFIWSLDYHSTHSAACISQPTL